MIPADRPAPAPAIEPALSDLLADFLVALASDDYGGVLRQRERIFGRIIGEPGDLTALRFAVGMAASAFSMRSLCQADARRADWDAVVVSLEAVMEAELAALLRHG